MDRSADDRTPAQINETIRLKRASIDNRLELLRLRRARLIGYAALAAVGFASLAVAVGLVRSHRSRR